MRRRSGRPRAATRRLAPAGALERAGQAQVGHEPVRLGLLAGVEGGEVAGPQHLGAAEAQGQVGSGIVVVGHVGLGRLRRIGVVGGEGDRLLGHRLGGGPGPAAEPVAGEGLVVEGDLLGPVHERGPARPVERRRLGRQPAQRLGVEQGAAHRHGHPGAAQLGEEAVDGRARLVDPGERGSHRSLSRPGCGRCRRARRGRGGGPGRRPRGT